VAVAALRSRACREVITDDHAAVLRIRSRRHQDLGHSRNRRQHRDPVPWPGSLRCLERHRPGRGPPAAGRSTGCRGAGTGGSTTRSTSPRSPGSGTSTAPAAPATSARSPRARPQGGAARSQAADQRRDLRPPAGRRPNGGGIKGPGRATGERLWLQRGRLPPRTPALRTSHSRATTQTTARRHPARRGRATASSNSRRTP
jgi:hypothetical protein